MNRINLKGVHAETVTNLIILFIALVNAGLQMFGIDTLPIKNNEVSNVVSLLFLIITSLWNTWKNRNFTTASQIAQNLTDAIKNGELLEDEIKALIQKFE